MFKAFFKQTHYSFWITVGSILSILLHGILFWLKSHHIGKYPNPDLPLLAAITLGGVPLIFQIIKKIFHKNFGADLLAGIALVTAFLLGQHLAAVLVMLMISGGQVLEKFAMRKASAVLLALSQRMPSQAHRKVGERITDVLINHIRIGDLIVVYPHETSPIDGTVVEGHGSMNESYLTGEPYQVSKTVGASVLSGAINGEAALVVRAEKLVSDSRYTKIMEVMRDAEQKRPNMRRIGDQVGMIFTPVALIDACLAWYFTGDSVRFLSVLVIATPCPLIIAIPVSIVSAISLAAKRGIIIKDPIVLERLPTCRTAIFDKTGTLTYGQPKLTEVLPAKGISADQILQYTASVERYSKHPLAQSILKAADQSKLFLIEASEVSEKPGEGLSGTVEGHVILVTHRKKILQMFPDSAVLLPPISAGLECIVLQDNQYAATFHFRDMPRKEGKSFIHHLGPSHQFTKIMLVSGDRESEVHYLAGILGIQNTLASQNPEQKLAIVREEVSRAPTLFMGDGINDAPALAAATVGIAFGQHSNVTSEAAGAVILDNTLVKVDELMHLSIALRKIVLQSAVGGMLLSFVGMGFASAGYISPVTGAILQEVIDVLAIANALRLIWGKSLTIDLPVSS